jgi:hypothetical protein
MSQPLVPVVNRATATVAKADAPAYLEALLALTPLPTGKTSDQLINYVATVNKASGEISIRAQFSS